MLEVQCQRLAYAFAFASWSLGRGGMNLRSAPPPPAPLPLVHPQSNKTIDNCPNLHHLPTANTLISNASPITNHHHLPSCLPSIFHMVHHQSSPPTTNPAKQTPSKHPAAILLDSAQVSDDTDRQDLQVGKISFSDILYCTEESVSVCAGDPNDTKRFWRRKRPTRAQPNPKDAPRTMMRHKVW